MAKNKIRMPSSEGGLVRYYDEEYKSKFMLSPKIITVACIVLAVFLIGLRFL